MFFVNLFFFNTATAGLPSYENHVKDCDAMASQSKIIANFRDNGVDKGELFRHIENGSLEYKYKKIYLTLTKSIYNTSKSADQIFNRHYQKHKEPNKNKYLTY